MYKRQGYIFYDRGCDGIFERTEARRREHQSDSDAVSYTHLPDNSRTLEQWADEIHTTIGEIMPEVKTKEEYAESFLSGGVDSDVYKRQLLETPKNNNSEGE